MLHDRTLAHVDFEVKVAKVRVTNALLTSQWRGCACWYNCFGFYRISHLCYDVSVRLSVCDGSEL